jgi:hypothetical protein
VLASGTAAFASASTAANGNYTIVGLPAGSYTLALYAPFDRPKLQDGYYRGSVAGGFTSNPANATPVAVGPSKTGVDADLPTGYEISGKITRSSGMGVPSPFVTARKTNTGQAFFVIGGANGNYLFQGLPPGTYTVQVSGNIDLNLLGGWYRAGAPGNYTANQANATGVTIGP